jgi:hypothetical protein
VKLLRSYGRFLEEVKNDPWTAAKYYRWGSRLGPTARQRWDACNARLTQTAPVASSILSAGLPAGLSTIYLAVLLLLLQPCVLQLQQHPSFPPRAAIDLDEPHSEADKVEEQQENAANDAMLSEAVGEGDPASMLAQVRRRS